MTKSVEGDEGVSGLSMALDGAFAQAAAAVERDILSEETGGDICSVTTIGMNCCSSSGDRPGDDCLENRLDDEVQETGSDCGCINELCADNAKASSTIDEEAESVNEESIIKSMSMLAAEMVFSSSGRA